MGNLGWPELLVVVLIVLIVFGAKRVPEIFRSLGSGVNEFKKGLNEGPSEKDRTDAAKPQNSSTEPH